MRGNVFHGGFGDQAGSGFAALRGILIHEGKYAFGQGDIDPPRLATDFREIDGHQGPNTSGVISILLMRINGLWRWKRFMIGQSSF